MKKTVKVLEVLQDYSKEKRDGGTYQCTLFKYQDGDRVRDIALANAFLSKVPGLAAKIHAVEAGSMAEITLEKNGMYWNLIDVGEPGASSPAPASAGSSGSRSSGASFGDARQDSIIFQNAMAHATALSIHNSKGKAVDIQAVISLAKQIALVSRKPQLDEVVAEKGASKAPAASSATVIDDDIPFGE
jgi:hypothetical protein